MRSICCSFFCLVFVLPALGAEGFWTPENFPYHNYSIQFPKKEQAALNPSFFNQKLSSVFLLNSSCTAVFITSDGLALTNRHCLDECLEQARKSHQLGADGAFSAQKQINEFSCKFSTADTLVKKESSSKPATNHCYQAHSNESSSDFCRTSSDNSLFYYRRYSDIRLVFVPEQSIARYGGEEYNFKFPRYSFDMGLVRIYQNDKPLKNENFLPLSDTLLKDGQAVFILGVPGKSRRSLVPEEAQFLRDVKIPTELHLFKIAKATAAKESEQSSQAKYDLIQLNNTIEVLTSELSSLKKSAISTKDKKLLVLYRKYAQLYPQISRVDHFALNSKIYLWAKILVRQSYEESLAPERRSFSYSAENLKLSLDRLSSDTSFDTNYEQSILHSSIAELLKQDKEFAAQFKKNFKDRKDITALTKKMIQSELVHNLNVRQKLSSLSWAQLQQKNDPLIQLAVILEKRRQLLSKTVFQKFESKLRALHINKPALAYTEADQTPRISYGKIQNNSAPGSAFTFINDVYEKNLSPIPTSWLNAKKNINLKTQLNFTCTADSVGGSSGSALIDEHGNLVGLVFDAANEARDTELFYTEHTNRTVALSASAIKEALKSVYHFKYTETENTH